MKSQGTYSELDDTETAESKRIEPKGPTFALSTCTPSFVRSNLMISFCPNIPTAYTDSKNG